MKLKPQISRSLVLKEGKCLNEQPFEVAGEIIPFIQKERLKNLGRICNGSVTGKQVLDNFKKKRKELIQKNSKSLLTGIMKVWMY